MGKECQIMDADKSNLRNAAAWKIDVVEYTKNNERIKMRSGILFFHAFIMQYRM